MDAVTDPLEMLRPSSTLLASARSRVDHTAKPIHVELTSGRFARDVQVEVLEQRGADECGELGRQLVLGEAAELEPLDVEYLQEVREGSGLDDALIPIAVTPPLQSAQGVAEGIKGCL